MGKYEREFGRDCVIWTPIEDFHLCDLETLTEKILPFLVQAERQGEKAVVHCSGGIGRTGHILAAWLVSFRGFSNKNALVAIRKMGRNPYESAIASIVTGKNPFTVLRELHRLLDDCRLRLA